MTRLHLLSSVIAISTACALPGSAPDPALPDDQLPASQDDGIGSGGQPAATVDLYIVNDTWGSVVDTLYLTPCGHPWGGDILNFDVWPGESVVVPDLSAGCWDMEAGDSWTGEYWYAYSVTMTTDFTWWLHD